MSHHEPTDPPDHELIAAAAGGDRRAFDRFVSRHAGSVHRLARALTTDEAAAEDVVQEAFLSAYRSAATYRPDVAPARTWLFAITRNAARHAGRAVRERPQPVVLDEEPLLTLGLEAGWGADLPAEDFERAEEVERLARAFAALRADDREILVLRDLEGLPGEAVAELLGATLAGMKSRLHRARLRLLATLREEGGTVVEREREIGGLTCSQVLERLGDYVDGDSPPDDVARIETHLRDCGVCERFGGRYGRVVHGVRLRLGASVVDDAQLDRIRRLLAEL